MNHSEDNGALMFLGGTVVVIVIGAAVVKAAGQFFKELEIAFYNFGKMTGAFIPMAWNVFLVISLIALTLSAIACGVYFSWKYFQKVNELMEVRSWLQNEMASLDTRINKRISDKGTRFTNDIADLRNYAEKIDARLKEAIKVNKEVAPPTPTITQPIEAEASVTPNSEHETPTESTTINALDEATLNVSNPY